jgi:hypothetical protein
MAYCSATIEVCKWLGKPGCCHCRFPVNVIFVGMIGTSFWALQALNVAMVTVSVILFVLFKAGSESSG